jgi:hypothetical protein
MDKNSLQSKANLLSILRIEQRQQQRKKVKEMSKVN